MSIFIFFFKVWYGNDLVSTDASPIRNINQFNQLYDLPSSLSPLVQWLKSALILEPGIRIFNNSFVIDRDYLVLVFQLRKVMCVMQLLALLIPLSIHDYLWAAFFSFPFWPSDPNFSDIIFLVKFHLYQVQTVPLNYKENVI